MEFIIIFFSAIVSWITSNILNKLFGKKTAKEVLELNNRRLIELLETREETISKLEKENKKRELEKSSIFQSIRRSGLSIDKLIAEYDKPINAILISAYSQKKPGKTIYGEPYKFVSRETERYDGRHLGSGVYLIPPPKVPKWIHNRDDLKKWFKEEILKNRYCVLKFLILFDIRENAFWMNNLQYTQARKNASTIGEVLTIEDLFNEEQIAQTTTIAKIISHGDIGWLAYKHVGEDDLATLRLNQLSIEDKLGNPTLRELARGNYQSKLKTVLEEFNIHNSEEVAKLIISEAKFWNRRIK